ncbi:MAG: hypothetical protein CMJ59_06470 [Planctomycetaceae bacterium]|nr:hypothetical protein [Planctomycetaceae bacterium]
MNQRERTLALCVAFLAVFVMGTFAFNWFRGAVDVKDAEIRNLTSRRDTEAYTIGTKGRLARKRFNEYRSRSLPGITAVASSRYSDWLRQVVEQVGLKGTKVDYVAARNRGDLYKQLQFDIVGKGDIEQLTEFLFEFYQQDYLHRIDRLILNPTGKSMEDLNISIRIEAVSMVAVADRMELEPLPSNRLKLEKLSDYTSIISGRNLFAPGNQVPRFVTDDEPQQMTLGRRGSVRIRADAGDRGQDVHFRLVSTDYPEADEIPKESDSGRFSFTPAKTGDFNIVVEVVDSGPGPNNKATKEFAFTVSEPEPEPEREDPLPDFDVARSMYITAVIERNGEPQLWLHLRTTNETLQLRAGDRFRVADATGTIRAISFDTGRVEFELGGQIWQARKGSNLADVDPVGEADGGSE